MIFVIDSALSRGWGAASAGTECSEWESQRGVSTVVYRW